MRPVTRTFLQSLDPNSFSVSNLWVLAGVLVEHLKLTCVAKNIDFAFWWFVNVKGKQS